MKAYLYQDLSLIEIEIPEPVKVVDGEYIQTTKGPIHRAFIVTDQGAQRFEHFKQPIEKVKDAKKAFEDMKANLYYHLLVNYRLKI